MNKANGTNDNNNIASNSRSPITTAVARPTGISFLCKRCILAGSPPADEGVIAATSVLDVTISTALIVVMSCPRD